MSYAVAYTATDGDAYDMHMGRWSRRLAEVFLDFAGVEDGEQVLDLGSGTGSLTFAIANRASCRAICGVDKAEAYIAHARERTKDRRIEFRVGDATQIPLVDGSVDRVLSQLLLSFVPDTQAALAEMRRVARPGATIAAAIWDTKGGHVTNRLIWDIAVTLDPSAQDLRSANYTRPLTRPGEMAEAWRRAGLQDIEEGMLGSRMSFASFDDFWLPNLGKQGPFADYLATLDEERFERLREHIRLAYLAGEEDGPRSFAAVALAVKGTVPH